MPVELAFVKGALCPIHEDLARETGAAIRILSRDTSFNDVTCPICKRLRKDKEPRFLKISVTAVDLKNDTNINVMLLKDQNGWHTEDLVDGPEHFSTLNEVIAGALDQGYYLWLPELEKGIL
jgi:hypothetical protein